MDIIALAIFFAVIGITLLVCGVWLHVITVRQSEEIEKMKGEKEDANRTDS